MTASKHLEASLPSWVTISRRGAKKLRIDAKPTLVGGESGAEFELEIKDVGGGVKVFEAIPGTRLPPACPERHINYDGSFCVGLNEGKQITNAVEAEKWWVLLGDYLRFQQAAEKYRRWPPGHWLSHGKAALAHLELEKIASQVGWEDEVFSAIEFRQGWLSRNLPRVRRSSDMLVNQRAPCPRGCASKGKAILRRNCPNRAVVFRLVKAELDRRDYENLFVEEFKQEGFQCCGTMAKCPFR